MPADPLPEIKEDAAEGLIAALYDDIRAVIGVPMVNLIFRNMATMPGCLEWAWAVIRPLYIEGQIPDAAKELTDSVLPGKRADLARPIAAEGLSASEVTEIDRVLQSYGRANPMNAVGLNVIDLALDRAVRKTMPGLTKPPAEDALLKPEGIAPLLPMVDPATAPDRTRNALTRLAIQIHGSDTGVIPSLYRHFGAWPTFLESLEEALAPALSDGIEEAAQRMLKDSRAKARALYNTLPLPDTPHPDEAADTTLKRLIQQFPPNICRMTVLATLLRRGLPQN